MKNSTIPPVKRVSRPIADLITLLQRANEDKQAVLTEALPALDRLSEVMRNATGQSYSIRSILFSLYNGKPVSLLSLLGLDWELRQDLALVMLIFGFESGSTAFFYAEMKAIICKRVDWEWFVAESEVE